MAHLRGLQVNASCEKGACQGCVAGGLGSSLYRPLQAVCASSQHSDWVLRASIQENQSRVVSLFMT